MERNGSYYGYFLKQFKTVKKQFGVTCGVTVWGYMFLKLKTKICIWGYVWGYTFYSKNTGFIDRKGTYIGVKYLFFMF
ncbi:hypothetical protein DWW23_23320 [Parabacteroides sp. AF14-59]|nr:hypothetical protein DWW23_23320 [Parabacteroides sp. AF14-59]